MKMNTIETHRYLVLLVDIKNGNPQGDPDLDNHPRMDPQTNLGLITPAGPKRKLRDLWAIDGQGIYVARGACYQRTNKDLANGLGIGDVFGAVEEEDTDDDQDEEDAKAKVKAKKAKAAPKKRTATPEEAIKIHAELCKKFLDVRLFGQLVPGLPGTLRGPVQFSMGESLDPIHPSRLSITRVAVATEKEESAQNGANHTMGGVWYIPYGLYRFHIYVNPNDARRSHCTEEDYDLFVKSIPRMFDYDRSSGRSSACVRALYEFRINKETHGNAHGTVHGERLLESVQVRRRDPNAKHPRTFDDYAVTFAAGIDRSPNYEFRRIVSEKSPWTFGESTAAE